MQNTDKSNLTEKEQICNVYNATTQQKKPKKKRRDKSDLGPDFVAPDGGWGWVVCLAAGFSNLCIFPALQQYGLIYRQRLQQTLGFDAKETTTIVNLVMAISSLVGIVNGAMFRRFTFRQVAVVGSLLVFIGLFCSAFSTTFVQYVISLSCIYGIGLGLAMAATSLAVNVYFKQRRRRATGFAWTITGFGPIIFPHVSTFLLSYYGTLDTIVLFSGLALNALVCALTLQPVQWHTRKPKNLPQTIATHADANGIRSDYGESEKEANGNLLLNVSANSDAFSDYECKYCQYMRRQKRSIFSSQYLFNNDDPERPGYEIIEPGTPMLARANDGWFGSKLSLASEKGMRYRKQHKLHANASSRSREHVHLESATETVAEAANAADDTAPQLYKPNYFNREREETDRYESKQSVYSKIGYGEQNEMRCTCVEEKLLLQKSGELLLDRATIEAAEAAEEEAKRRLTFRQKVVRFFDLDLLKDITFVNLVNGMTVMMFGEMNFSVLTPFILNSYGYSDKQISMAMSLLGGVDISVRFLAPFALEKVKLDNRVLFAMGIITIAIGRFIITFTNSYNVVLCMFAIIGFGKGFRTIFSPLIIPSYVPLKRLPAASGLQLIYNTIFSIFFGPILGLVTDAFGYSMTIHLINGLTCFALLMWLTESMLRRLLGKPPVGISD